MNNTISISLGIPKHGWLPVNFRYQDFRLEFDASDINDPLEERNLRSLSYMVDDHATYAWCHECGKVEMNF